MALFDQMSFSQLRPKSCATDRRKLLRMIGGASLVPFLSSCGGSDGASGGTIIPPSTPTPAAVVPPPAPAPTSAVDNSLLATGATVNVSALTTTDAVGNLTKLEQAVQQLAQSGGGNLIVPFVEGGVQIASTWRITSSNIRVILLSDIFLVTTMPAAAISFEGKYGNPISNTSIFGSGSRKVIDGNGSKMTGYTYQVGSAGHYSSVQFLYCENWIAQNIEARNGLVNSFKAFFSPKGRATSIVGSYAAYDNGISIDFDNSVVAWSDSDSSSWNGSLVENCEAYHNESVGIAQYASTAVTIRNCKSTLNGNDDISRPHNGAGFSSEGDFFSQGGQNKGRNLRGVFENCVSEQNFNQGFHVSAVGTKIIAARISATKTPVNKPNRAGHLGSNIAIVNGATAFATSCVCDKAEGNGISLVGTENGFPILYWDGEVSNSGKFAIYGRGVAEVTTASGTKIINSAIASSSDIAVYIDNTGGTAYNTGGGKATLNGIVNRDIQRAVNIKALAYIDTSGLRNG